MDTSRGFSERTQEFGRAIDKVLAHNSKRDAMLSKASTIEFAQRKIEGFIYNYDGSSVGCYGYHFDAVKKIREITEALPWYLKPFRMLVMKYCLSAWQEALLLREADSLK